MATSAQVAFSQIVNYETKITIDGNDVKSTTKTILIQINNKQENWLSHVELRHNPREEFLFNYALLTNEEGDIVRKLKKKELITRNDLSNQAFYQDDLITEFDLYWNQYPYRIEYSYTIEEEEYLYLSWWTPLYYTNVTSMNSSLEVSIPSSYSIQINSPENLTFEESEIEDRKLLRWRSAKVKYLTLDEIYSPPIEKLMPIVVIVPSNFKYDVLGKADSWSSFGAWLDELNKGTDQITLQEKRIVEKLIVNINDREEIIKSLYYYLQDHTKYVNVAIDVGGLKSYPASYVCENKYGDCKALTTYMKAMLKSVGIESFYSIIKAGENEVEINQNIPSQQFNHVILMAPLEKDTIWLENTSNSLPFGYLGTFTQNRHALVIDGEKSQLIKTPKLSVEDVHIDRNYIFNIVSSDEASIDLNLIFRGKEFENFRYFISENDKELQNNYINYQKGIKDFKVNDWDIVDFSRDSTYLQLSINGFSSSIIRQIGSFQVINPLRIELPDFEKPDNRKQDVIINFPISKSDRSVYDVRNLAQSVIQVPDGIKIENNYGIYYANHTIVGTELTIVEQFILFANTISIEEYDDFYKFIDSINNYKKKTVILIE